MSRRAHWERKLGSKQSFSTKQAAQLMGVSSATVRRLVTSRRLRARGGPGHSVRHYRIDREDLLQFLLQQEEGRS